MHRRTWQKFEQRVCEFFGGSRKGPMQERDANDCKHPYLHIQCKHSKRNAMITGWYRAKEKTKTSGKIPVLAIGLENKGGFWVLCHNSDLIAVARQRGVNETTQS